MSGLGVAACGPSEAPPSRRWSRARRTATECSLVSELAPHLPRVVELGQRRVEVRPDNARAHHELGLGLLRLGRRSEAMTALRRAIEVDPSYAPAHCNLGLALEEIGDFVAAAGALREAQRLRPKSG